MYVPERILWSEFPELLTCRLLKGSIFYEIRERRQTGQGWDKGYGLRDLFFDLFGKRKKEL